MYIIVKQKHKKNVSCANIDCVGTTKRFLLYDEYPILSKLSVKLQNTKQSK